MFGTLTGCAPAGAAAASLPKYNVDISQTSVSGLSSGGFMAVQFEVAYSAILKGAGIVAGGPYDCAQGSLNTALQPCMAANGSTNVPALIRITDQNAGRGTIDPTTNLANHRIWMFSGTVDSVVKQPVMNDLRTYFLNYDNESNIKYVNNVEAEHAMPTDFFGNNCATKGDPYINNCHLDAAGEVLKWIYGSSLNQKNTGALNDGNFIEFDQSEFIAQPNSHSMATVGWAYVPASCAAGQACKLHVVFHGCKQYPSYAYFSGSGMVTFGMTYVRNTGYNQWADTNNIIVLYPQAFNGSNNPNGCWDWWGYDDPNYAVKTGNQMKAVKAMVDRISSGASHLASPVGLTVTNTTDTSVSLSWDEVSGAAGYNVYRGGTKTNASPVTRAIYTDSSLSPGTEYRYVVKAADSVGAEGPPSSEVVARTSGQPPVVAPPTNLTVRAVTNTTIALSWTAAAGVAGYDVFRLSGTDAPMKVNATLVTDTSYTVAGLAPGTRYTFSVRSENRAGASSVDSNSVSATTSTTAACFTSSNFAHVQAGRAHDSRGYALANGSNERMGLDNVFFTTTLKQTGPSFYVIDHLTCP
jgi:poly(3-hydroxybutyrate) depolymerase/chitodextrinase